MRTANIDDSFFIRSVLKVYTILINGVDCCVRATGKDISLAVDVCEFIINHFLQGTEYIDLFIYSEEYKENRSRSVIEITLKTPKDYAHSCQFVTEVRPKDKDIERFDRFLQFYRCCPICRRFNDTMILRTIYFNITNKETIYIKNELVKIMENSNKTHVHNNLIVGIPCCKCYEEN